MGDSLPLALPENVVINCPTRRIDLLTDGYLPLAHFEEGPPVTYTATQRLRLSLARLVTQLSGVMESETPGCSVRTCSMPS